MWTKCAHSIPSAEIVTLMHFTLAIKLSIHAVKTKTYTIQVAQLSQRDRAAGWVSYGQKCRLELGDKIYGPVSYTHLTLPTNREV